MLTELYVENFGLMESVRLKFDRGLTVFTGETGAGKSMLIDALGVLLGGRASADLIRHEEAQARIEGVLEDLTSEYTLRLEEAGYPMEEGQLFLYREINSSGRNVCRVQGRTIPLTLYRSLCEGLVDIHGQIEHLSLFRAETHRDLLDALGGVQDDVDQVNEAAKAYQALIRKEQELSISVEQRQKREEILRYQIEEIEQVNPIPGEEEELNQEKKRLNNAERITSLISEAFTALYEGSTRGYAACDLLGQTRKILQELARLDETFDVIEQIESLYYAAEDLAEQIRTYRDSLEFEPGRLDQIERRLIELTKLRKYGLEVEAILEKRLNMIQELDKITHVQEQFETLHKQQKSTLKAYDKVAKQLSQKRLEIAQRIEQGLALELSDLGLERSRFEVRFIPNVGPTVGGAERIEFYFSANLGEPPKPLAKVASGGEMSRLMLALKSLLAKVEPVGTFIFDEVDSGVGGRTIHKVGEKLAKIASDKQVFCITHAAQVAAFADVHYGILKEVNGTRTRTRVDLLTESDRIEELARMLGGGEIEITRKHAQELWQRSGRHQ
ncbi:DNA repair protein RecN [Desulfosporosinus sp. BICA1-9]|uniref:DNA repair protein RecN n=1 Tax=Desulfosporosinus sp. BICA1-9 TaxID=1531958 RepID=UPI00054BD511|nr:DNA repair protein RecN [Desulfosporosinus sp. BICA1-9]KJS49828.1 MAG: DNA recombination protein RecN [Peptococcaceae bacterium BRH_c23]KJS78778.1 MAG: DNA recombination protein RecN [Desulfosporosinus sp. BICA1-9]HBW36058.1 DNA repair protein RecN [Desulfosporosinus sp.]